MVMPDLEDPFVPLSNGLFVNPYESRYALVSLDRLKLLILWLLWQGDHHNSFDATPESLFSSQASRAGAIADLGCRLGRSFSNGR